MSKKQKKSSVAGDIDFMTASSVTDCTGIVPSAPQNEYELNSYLEIMKFSPKSIEVKKKKQ